MIRLSLLVIAGLVISATASAEDYLDNWRGQRVLKAQQLLFNDEFAAVDSIYREHIEDHPGDPAGYLFRAGALFAEMSAREEIRNEELFEHSLDSVETLTTRMLDSCDARTAAWMYLLRGHARAYRSLYASKFGSFISALKLGLATIDEYENGLKADSSLYDLYFGIGSYHYWKSAKAGLLKLIRVFKEEKQQGIDELRLAADSSLLHRDLARSALIWVWLDRKQYDSAIVLAQQYAEQYPKGNSFLFPLAEAYLKSEDYAAAAQVYRRLRKRLTVEPGNYYNLVEADYQLARCHSWLSDNDQAKAVADRFVTYYEMIPASTLKRQRSRINYMKRIGNRN